MTKIPISIVFFTSTKGHFGFKDIYLTTLSHLDKQIPLGDFAVKIAHIKVTPGEETAGDVMELELNKRGFKVLKSTAPWNRGQSHQNEYLKDIIKISLEKELYNNPYIMWLEDDSTLTFNTETLLGGFARMIKMLDEDNNLLSVRLLRKSDYSTTPVGNPQKDYFYSEHFNFQPLIMRSRDFFLANKIIDDNLNALSNTQIEMAWRLVLAPFSRSLQKHIVFHPDYAETVHLGVTDYPEIKKSLNL